MERALLGGESLREISEKFGCSRSSLARHGSAHLAGKLAAARGASEAASSGRLLDRMERIVAETDAILAEAKAQKDLKLSLRAIARLEKQVELSGRIVGILQAAPVTINLSVTQEWIDLRVSIVAAVRPYPEAAAALAAALVVLDA
jgi:transposase-like protein